MGRKTNQRGREKRLQRKEEALRLIASKAVVDAANKLTDPLEPFPVFRKFQKNGLNIELTIRRVTDLDESEIDWAFQLTKNNMEEKYKLCTWGWNDKKKLEEMTEETAWYLLATNSDGGLVGFSHFRFDLDYGDEVLYCYELQLDKRCQRKSLGKFMMQILELVAFKNNMKKVVLTVLKNTTEAKAFYTALNYKLDDTSPVDDYDNEYPYEILSKINRRLINEEQQNKATTKSSSNSSLKLISSLMHQNQCCSLPHCHKSDD